MADDAQVPAGEQQDTTQASTATPEPAHEQQAETADDGYKGAGSKEALKRDLARERDMRQQTDSEFRQFREGLAKALGYGQEDPVTPEQLTQQLTQAQSERDSLNTRLQVFLNAPDGVDVKALLDSRSFTDSLNGLNLDSPEQVTEAINTFIDAHPRFRTQTGPAAGARDVTAGRAPATGAFSMDDLIRGRH